MRAIERSSAFKRDYKREFKGRHRKVLDDILMPVLKALAMDEPLEDQRLGHPLSGYWVDYRECHLKPDLLLIYRKVGAVSLRLARLGSHSELFD